MKKQISRRTAKSRAPEAGLFIGDADERRAAPRSLTDENAFVEDMDVDADYERGVEEVTRRHGWGAFA